MDPKKSTYNLNLPFWYNSTDKKPTQFYFNPNRRPLIKNDDLYKTDCTTQKTHNLYSRLEKYTLHRELDSNAPNEIRVITTFEYTMTNVGGKNFCEEGNSGALSMKRVMRL